MIDAVRASALEFILSVTAREQVKLPECRYARKYMLVHAVDQSAAEINKHAGVGDEYFSAAFIDGAP